MAEAYLEENPQNIAQAEMVVAIPSYREAKHIAYPTTQAALGLKRYFGPDPDMQSDDDERQDPPAVSRHSHFGSNVVPLSASHRQLHVSVRLNATTMDHAQQAVDSLKDRSQVILNLEHADDGIDRRILDFVAGACYALDGVYQRVGHKVFLFAPSNVYIEIEDELAGSVGRGPAYMCQQG